MRLLEGKKIGLVGRPSNWLVASSPDPQLLESLLGVKIVSVRIEELISEITQAKGRHISNDLEILTSNAKEIREPTQSDLDDAGATLQALRLIIERNHLDAITVRCFDLVLDLETTGCFALSQLLDEGLISACEGDLVSTIGMMAAKGLTGETPWMANPAQVDVEKNSFVLAHCTVPRSIVESYSVRSHFESGLGIGIQGQIQKGPVTVFRLGGKELEKFWLVEGEIIHQGDSEKLCRTQVEIKLEAENVTDLLEQPLGNHLVMIKGRHAQVLRSWFESEVYKSLKEVV